MTDKSFYLLEEWVDPILSDFWNKKERSPIILDKESKEKLDNLTNRIIQDFQQQNKIHGCESTNQG